MRKRIDMIGKRFGHWTVLREDGLTSRKTYNYLCLCDCGTLRTVDGSRLRDGSTTSCGCAHPGSTPISDETLDRMIAGTDDEARLMALLTKRQRELGLSDTEAAKRAYISHGRLSKWRCGRGTPKLDSLIFYAKALGMRVTVEKVYGIEAGSEAP